MNRTSAAVLFAMTLPALAGCAAVDRDANAEAIARPAGLKRMTLPTDTFVLTTYTRLTTPYAPITVYIEGDGLAWISRTQPSRDPTPKEAMGLSLAALDRSPNVVYLARPCQYTPRDKNPSCTVDYWTGKRFAPEVIASINQALDRIAARAPGQKLNLVGYSGGGAVAVLAAAERKDVASIRTIAGNLDHNEVNRLNDVSPLSGSLNAIDVAKKIKDIPQIHWSGGDDDTIPPSVAKHYADASKSTCVRTETIPEATHDAGWKERWRNMLKEIPGCDGPA